MRTISDGRRPPTKTAAPGMGLRTIRITSSGGAALRGITAFLDRDSGRRGRNVLRAPSPDAALVVTLAHPPPLGLSVIWTLYAAHSSHSPYCGPHAHEISARWRLWRRCATKSGRLFGGGEARDGQNQTARRSPSERRGRNLHWARTQDGYKPGCSKPSGTKPTPRPGNWTPRWGTSARDAGGRSPRPLAGRVDAAHVHRDGASARAPHQRQAQHARRGLGQREMILPETDTGRRADDET